MNKQLEIKSYKILLRHRQSERKETYRKYAEQLVKEGFAYYAFDTPEELEKMRYDYKMEHNPSNTIIPYPYEDAEFSPFCRRDTPKPAGVR
ncbi:MAG: hypothetical protein IPH18_12640, partial [Chitinophagaceae bacterium]|nr:hypothetical protein [Chitinophagaceae bacterium]